jgi:hypothetical protein
LEVSIGGRSAIKVNTIFAILSARAYRPTEHLNPMKCFLLPLFLRQPNRQPTAGDRTERDKRQQRSQAELKPSAFGVRLGHNS